MKTPDHVIVTGGAGFIGSHLVERLLDEGHRVTVIDDFSSGAMQNLEAVTAHSRFKLVRSKVSEYADLDPLVASAQAIYHLAAAVGVERVIQSPIQTILTNLGETERILAAAGKSGTPTLIASTSEVYGKSSKRAFCEEDDLLIGPPHLGRWSYACSKLMDEFLALAYARERQLPVVVARLFNTVGPRQTGRYGMVLPRFIAAAKSGKPLVVYGDGKQTRCFCDVADTVEVLQRLMRIPAAFGQVFNVGNEFEISIRHLAERVIEKLDSSSTIEYLPYDQAYAPGFDDMIRRRPNIDKGANLTGFRPGTTLDWIIERTAAAAHEGKGEKERGNSEEMPLG
jgi:UDP-glucose 4-epimerase